ncbi:transposase for insertion sequence [Streptococcus pneumoniae]|nr:transposase for insertion sequence [Streptococcus pneumoniae]
MNETKKYLVIKAIAQGKKTKKRAECDNVFSKPNVKMSHLVE